jgi:RimJ/RimL family protein N-acetyltransferase
MERITTERLIGTRPLLRDADELHPVVADPRVADWLWPGDLGGPRTLAQTRALLLRDADRWKRYGYGPWLLRDAASGRVVGRAGLAPCSVAGREEVEVGWFIAADRWGEGLATEIATAAVRTGFAALGLASVVAFTTPHNAASRAVMTKCGFGYEADIEHIGLPHVLYRLTNSEEGGEAIPAA